MNQKQTLWLLALLVVAGVVLGRQWLRSPNRAIDLQPEQVLGEVLAEETGSWLGRQGKVLIIIDPAAGPLAEAQLDSLRKALKRQGTVTVAAVEAVQPIDPLLRTMNPGGSGLSAESFLKLIEAHPEATGVLSLAGFPELPPGALQALKQKGCRCAAVLSAGLGPKLQAALQAKVLQWAVVPRWEEETPAAPPGQTARDRFNQAYQLIKAP